MKNKLTPYIIILIFFLLFVPSKPKENGGFSFNVDLLAAEGMVAIQVVNTDFQQDTEVVPNKICKCNGTGTVKSGDGIIDVPCICQPNCKCSKTEITSTCKCGCNKTGCNCSKSGCLPQSVMNDDAQFTYKFGAKWCGPCLTFDKLDKPQLIMLGWKFGRISQRSGIHVLEVDVDENPELFAQYNNGDKEIPLFVSVKGKNKINHHVGYMDYKEFSNWHNTNFGNK